MRYILFFVLTVMAQSQPEESPDDQYQWELFKLEHMKEYRSEKEENHRKTIFLSNVKFVREHNAKYEKGDVTFEVEINKFADMTNKEFLRTMNPAAYNRSEEEFEPEYASDLPENLDWRKKGAVTNVKDQGNCGASWAFSAAGALEGQWFLKKNKLVSLSVQNLVDCSLEYGSDGCEGGLLRSAFDYVSWNGGINTEASYPYKGQSGCCHYNREEKGATATGFVIIYPRVEDDIRYAVNMRGPLSVSIDGSHSSFQFYKRGIYNEPHCSRSALHNGVLIIGYGTVTKGGEYWLVKNSWGTNWGMEGYIMIARNNNNMCGITTRPMCPHVSER